MTESNQAKWKVPACKQCNNRFSRIEKDLIERLGLCLSPHDPLTMHVARKAMRALKPSLGHTETDSEQRARKRLSIMKRLYDVTSDSGKGFLPYFGPNNQLQTGPRATVKISEEQLNEFGTKLIRGMLFVTRHYYIGPEYEVKCYVNTEESDRNLFRPFYLRRGERYELAPGINATIIMSEKPPASLFRFEFWSRLVLSGSVIQLEDTTEEA